MWFQRPLLYKERSLRNAPSSVSWLCHIVTADWQTWELCASTEKSELATRFSTKMEGADFDASNRQLMTWVGSWILMPPILTLWPRRWLKSLSMVMDVEPLNSAGRKLEQMAASTSARSLVKPGITWHKYCHSAWRLIVIPVYTVCRQQEATCASVWMPSTHFSIRSESHFCFMVMDPMNPPTYLWSQVNWIERLSASKTAGTSSSSSSLQTSRTYWDLGNNQRTVWPLWGDDILRRLQHVSWEGLGFQCTRVAWPFGMPCIRSQQEGPIQSHRESLQVDILVWCLHSSKELLCVVHCPGLSTTSITSCWYQLKAKRLPLGKRWQTVQSIVMQLSLLNPFVAPTNVSHLPGCVAGRPWGSGGKRLSSSAVLLVWGASPSDGEWSFVLSSMLSVGYETQQQTAWSVPLMPASRPMQSLAASTCKLGLVAHICDDKFC